MGALTSLIFPAIATILVTMTTTMTMTKAANLTQFSSILVFGDSTVDTGNNNYLPTFFRGNHSPYGQDFPGHVPTGRFSDGKLIPDFVASLLGIKQTVPPFLDPSLSDQDLQTGVCFASAGSGYDDITAAESQVISMPDQLHLFRNYLSRLKSVVGENQADHIIATSLIIVSAGTNDFVYNYYDSPTRKTQFSISSYQDFLLTNLRNFIKELYNLGGRSMVIVGLPPIGCLPFQITSRLKNVYNYYSMERLCLEDENSDSQAYNMKLIRVISELQASSPHSQIVYANVFDPMLDMITHPHNFGFVEAKRGCCGSGLVEAGTLCNEVTPTCEMPSEFLFWDAIHPTEAAYKSLSYLLQQQLLSFFLK